MKHKGFFTAIFLLTLACLAFFVPARADSVYFANEPLPEAMVGVYYSTRVRMTGDDIPYVITLTTNPAGDNDFPPEMGITPDGVIYGTPKHAGVFPFSLQAAYGTNVTTFCVTKLVVREFSQDALKQGGGDPRIVGEGNDSLTGVANGVNGGRVTMQPGNDTAFFVSSKNKLYEIRRPYQKAEELFPVPEYRWLDCIGDKLYYYQRYYYQPTGVFTHVPKGYYITRICSDPIDAKGRETLIDLNQKKIRDLAVTDRIVLYILGEDKGTLRRLPLKGGNAVVLRGYYEGRELVPDHAFPYNGHAYLRCAADGFIYRVALDGQVAERLTQEKARSFTISRFAGGDTLFYANSGGNLFRVPLSGGPKEAVGALKAGALNSSADYLYFANAADGNKLWRVAPDAPESAERLTSFAVDQVYVFDTMLAVQKAGGNELYLLSSDGAEPPVLIGK